MNKMRIVIIADSVDTQNAGIHVYTRNMIETLDQLSEVETFCLRIKGGSNIQFKNDIIVRGIIPFLKKDPFRVFISIPRTIRKLNPDIVIEPAHFGPFNLPRKIKRVTVIHDLTPILFPKWHNFISQNLQRIFLHSILKKASYVITNSNNTSKDVLAKYPFTATKIQRIYPRIDPFFRITKEEVILNKAPYFLSVGTIEPRKNLSLLLDAYQLFREKTNYTHSLVFCGGKGWKNEAFYLKIKNHPYKNDIKMMGYVNKEELKKLYATTTAFIYPSLYEGFGFPVAEAMGCGAPCIISDRASLPEVGGAAVKYFNAESTEDLTDKLIEMVSSVDLIQSLSMKGINQSALFSEKHFTRELEKFLMKLK
jgi:glycosyltransferase involved in cell wall biosynthesis